MTKDDDLEINCGNEFIDVAWAIYGGIQDTILQCGEPTTLLKIREKCQEQQQCRFRVPNGFFGDYLCQNLWVGYACLARGELKPRLKPVTGPKSPHIPI